MRENTKNKRREKSDSHESVHEQPYKKTWHWRYGGGSVAVCVISSVPICYGPVRGVSGGIR